MKKRLLTGVAIIVLGVASTPAANIQRRQIPVKAPLYA